MPSSQKALPGMPVRQRLLRGIVVLQQRGTVVPAMCGLVRARTKERDACEREARMTAEIGGIDND